MTIYYFCVMSKSRSGELSCTRAGLFRCCVCVFVAVGGGEERGDMYPRLPYSICPLVKESKFL